LLWIRAIGLRQYIGDKAKQQDPKNERIHCFLNSYTASSHPPFNPLPKTHGVLPTLSTAPSISMPWHAVGERWQTSKGGAGQDDQDSAVHSVGEEHVH
jgi:hypothetical protein